MRPPACPNCGSGVVYTRDVAGTESFGVLSMGRVGEAYTVTAGELYETNLEPLPNKGRRASRRLECTGAAFNTCYWSAKVIDEDWA